MKKSKIEKLKNLLNYYRVRSIDLQLHITISSNEKQFDKALIFSERKAIIDVCINDLSEILYENS